MKSILCTVALAGLLACERQPPPVPPDVPERLRIVALAPHLAELVYTAGAGELLVGVVAHSDYPAAARELPVVGDAFRIDPERLALLRPGLVLAWGTGNPEALIARLGSRGYRVEVLQTDRLADVADNLRRIGRLAGTEAIADAAAERYLRQLDLLQARYADAAPLEVFYQISAQPLYTVGSRHPISEMIRLCGGRNIFRDLDAVAPVVTVEEVLLRSPQVIIAGALPGADGLDAWLRWAALPAVSAGHLYAVDPSLVVRASTRMIDGMRAVCGQIERARRGQRFQSTS